MLGCSVDGRWLYRESQDIIERVDIDTQERESVALPGYLRLNPDASVLLVESKFEDFGADRPGLAQWGIETYVMPSNSFSNALLWGASGRQFLIVSNLQVGDHERTGRYEIDPNVLLRGALDGGDLTLTRLGRHIFETVGLVWFDRDRVLVRSDPESYVAGAYWCVLEAQMLERCRHTFVAWTDIAAVPGRAQFFAVRRDGLSDCLVLTTDLDRPGTCLVRMNHIVLSAGLGPIVFREPTEIVFQATRRITWMEDELWNVFRFQP